VWQFDEQQAFSTSNSERTLLKLLLFVDERPSSRDCIPQVKAYLRNVQSNYSVELDIIEVNKQPHLVEYFKLVATPALVKLSPGSRQILAGSNPIEQLKKWWPKWQVAIDREESSNGRDERRENGSDSSFSSYSGELIELSDEIFRLKKEKEELVEQLRFKERILAILAHDLRSPLTAASIALETIELSDRQAGTSEAKIVNLKQQLFKQAKRQFGIMNRMIGELLQTSKVGGTKLKVKPQKLNLQVLCEDAIAQLEKAIKHKSLQFERDIPQDIPAIYGDEELLRQLIVNLLDNAIKYTPSGGEISLSILHRTSQTVQLNLCDTGPGIPAEKREQIFEGHFRLKRDRDSEGYGLGLSWCRDIVCAHYGQIWVDSPCDRGSCFHVILPTYR
jgi:two-component system, OmpR family, clock-associated histidine kinase SasA